MRTRLITLALALTLPLAATSAASAAGNPYTAKGLCGPGYTQIDHHALSDVGPNGVRSHLSAAMA